jgi:cobalt/nickel transport protein
VNANRARLGGLLFVGLLVALLLGGVASNFASAAPDGLDAVLRTGCRFDSDGRAIGGSCLAQHEQANQSRGSPLAGYGVRGIDNPFVATGLAGIGGVLVTFGVGCVVFRLARRRSGIGATT